MVIPLRTEGMPILKPDHLIVSIRALVVASFRKPNSTSRRLKKKESLIVYLTENSRINLTQLYPEVQYYH